MTRPPVALRLRLVMSREVSFLLPSALASARAVNKSSLVLFLRRELLPELLVIAFVHSFLQRLAAVYTDFFWLFEIATTEYEASRRC